MGEPALSADLDTIPKLLARNAGTFATRPAYREKAQGNWQSWTWAETEGEVLALATGLALLGLKAGDRIAVIGRNRPHLYWAMVASQAIGAIPVPLYPDATPDEIAHVLRHCEARFVVAGDQEQVDKLLDAHDVVPDIIVLDPRGMRQYPRDRLHSYADILDAGRSADAAAHEATRARIVAQGAGDTCVLLYTSGTTGTPKGVVLSHRNIIATARASAGVDRLSETDSILAWLPMGWVGDFVFSVGQAYWTGLCVNCPESAATIQNDLREVAPSYFSGPPRFFEALMASVTNRMEDASRPRRALFRHFIELAQRIGPAILDGRPVGPLDRARYALGRALVFEPLKSQLGLSRCRLGYTAGEAIAPDTFAFYRALGINLKQLYGQTEASVFVTQQPDGEARADTVGVPTPGVELRIAETGEVFYRSPGTFVEYYRDPAGTAAARDADGWVASGDAGFIEEGTGHLRIIDRAKDVGHTAAGDLFTPRYVENKLKSHASILEAVVFGMARPFCTAFIVIDPVAVGRWAERNGITWASHAELNQHPRVGGMILAHVEAVNRSLAADPVLAGCQIRRFLILHKQLDADDGELTRTRKLRRRFIAEKYADLIAALYDGATSVPADTEVTENGRKGAMLEIRDAATWRFSSVTQRYI